MANPLQGSNAPLQLVRDPGTFVGPVQALTADDNHLGLQGANLAVALPGTRFLFFPEAEAIQTYGANNFVEGVAETVALAEALASLMSTSQSVAESVGLSEALAAQRSAIQALAESVALAEASTSLYSAKPNVSESVGLAESAASAANRFATLAETVPLSEANNAVRTSSVALAETVALVEAILARLSANPSLAETVALAEALSASTPALLSETVALAEAISVQFGASQALAEALAIAEALAASRGNSVALSEAVALVEAAAASASYKPSVVETLTLAEQIVSALVPAVTLSESWGALVELVASVFVTYRTSPLNNIDSSLADPTRAAVSVVQGSTRRFTLSVVDDLGSPITSGSYTWKVSRRASDQDYVITKTVAVGVPFIFRPEDTAALASGFYSFEVTYKLGGVVRQAVKPSPFYVGQKVIEFRATYPTTAQPSFVPEVTVSLTGVFENGEPTSPGVPYNARTSIRLNPADTLIQITNVTPIGSPVGGGTVVFCLKKKATDATVLSQQAAPNSASSVDFRLTKAFLQTLPVGLYAYDVWFIDDLGTQIPVIPLSTFLVSAPS